MQHFPGTDDAAYKTLSRRWAASVNVITTRNSSATAFDGLTATAFLTISISPAIILVSISTNSSALETIRESGCFVVNILAPHQVEHSAAFSRPHHERTQLFDNLEHHLDCNGVPLLGGAAGAFSAQLREVIPAGDHVLVLGNVVEIHHGSSEESLVYVNRSYGTVRAL